MAGLLAAIPSPSFDRIALGPLNLRMYGLMIALGVIAAVWLTGRRLAERGYSTPADAGNDASAIAMWGVAGGIIGARLYHVATDWHRFEDNLGDIPKVWQGGLGIPGGIALGAAFGVYAGRQRGIPARELLSLAAPALPLAQAIGRFGNWFNQELYGRPTDLPWALEIDADHNGSHPAGTTFHPAFLYEALWNFGLCGLLLWIDRRWGNRLGAGKLFAVYVLGYGVGRLWIESLRIDAATKVAGLRWNQWMAMALIVGGLVWLIAAKNRPWAPSRRSTWPSHDEFADEADDDQPGQAGELVREPDDTLAEPVDELAALDGVAVDDATPDAGRE